MLCPNLNYLSVREMKCFRLLKVKQNHRKLLNKNTKMFLVLLKITFSKVSFRYLEVQVVIKVNLKQTVKQLKNPVN